MNAVVVYNKTMILLTLARHSLFLFSLLGATSLFSVLISQKMQLTGWDILFQNHPQR